MRHPKAHEAIVKTIGTLHVVNADMSAQIHDLTMALADVTGQRDKYLEQVRHLEKLIPKDVDQPSNDNPNL